MQPMTRDEYKRLGPHAGPYNPREIGIGIAIGLGIGGGVALAIPTAALWLVGGGAIMGGVFGTLPSMVNNQETAYQKYLTQFKQGAEISQSHVDVAEQVATIHGEHVARIRGKLNYRENCR